MSNLTRPRIKLPEHIKAGEIIDVGATIMHVMETGNRRDQDGRPIPRNVVHSVVARFRDNVVFEAKFGSGISANPFVAFPLLVSGPGRLEITWADDEGRVTVDAVEIKLSES